MRTFAGVLAVAAVLAAAGSAVAAKTITIGAKANGTTVHLQTGDKLRVSLRGNPSTGYTWEVLKVDRTVLKPGVWSYKPGGTKPGSGGVETRTFSALRAGTTRLKLGQVQAGSKRVAKTFLVIVAVG